MVYSIAAINAMDQEDFVATLGAIFEDTPAIAAQVWSQRPFENCSDLHRKMVVQVNAMDQEAQIALIRAHPELGSKAKMADASVEEQSKVGLNRLLPKEDVMMQQLNQQYREKFGFPFVIAVKGRSKSEILEVFARRLTNPVEVEQEQALTEIFQIAQFRLEALIKM